MKNQTEKQKASGAKEVVKVTVFREDRSKDKIVVSVGKSILKEIPAVVFDKYETRKLYQLISED